MNQNIFPAAVWVASTLFCGVAAADVYRWTDADGDVHFGDRPEHVTDPFEIKTADAGDPDETADPAADSTEDARAENCEKASQRLADYEKADQLIGEDEYGRKRDIVGEERVELILRAEKDVEEFCGEAAASAPGEPAPVKPAPAAKAAPQGETAPAEPPPGEESESAAESGPAALEGVESY